MTHPPVTPAVLSSSMRALLSGLIDYAGLFPPASLEMEDAVGRYATYRRGPQNWVLGRFILPVPRLEEFERAAAPHWRSGVAAPWRLSALIGEDVDRDLAGVQAFNARHAETREQHGSARAGGAAGDADGEQAYGGASGASATGSVGATLARVLPAQFFLGETVARIDTVEVKVDGPDAVRRIAGLMPSGLRAWFEIAPGLGQAETLAAVASVGQGAKLRTGGVTADKIPSSESIARFLCACIRAGTPFKATAGLHHPLRSSRRLTYADDGPTGLMHGFINVFLAAAVAREAIGLKVAEPEAVATVVSLLDEQDPRAFTWTDSYATWRRYRLEAATLAHVRDTLAHGFGSCSFDEPIAALRALNWM